MISDKAILSSGILRDGMSLKLSKTAGFYFLLQQALNQNAAQTIKPDMQSKAAFCDTPGRSILDTTISIVDGLRVLPPLEAWTKISDGVHWFQGDTL